MAEWYGPNMPFLGPGNTVLGRQEDIRLIQNDLLQLLYTLPGERVHRPNFGTPLRTSIFDPMSDLTISVLRDSILSAINREEPRLINVSVGAVPDRDNNLLTINITGQLTNDPSRTLTLEESIKVPPTQ